MRPFHFLIRLRKQSPFLSPRIGCWFLLVVLVQFNGIRNAHFPLSQSITKQGSLATLLCVIASSLIAINISNAILSRRIPRESKKALLEYTCISLLAASIISLLPSVNLFFQITFGVGYWIRWIRVALGVLVFITIQAFAMKLLSSKAQHHFLRIRAPFQSTFFAKLTAPLLFSICIAEMATHSEKPYLQVYPLSLLFNLVLLTLSAVILWSITNRDKFALALVTICYFLLSLANIAKINHLNAGLRIGDQSYLPELTEVKGYLGIQEIVVLSVLALAAVVVLVSFWQKSTCRLDLSKRVRWFMSSAICIAIVIGALCNSSSRAVFRHLGMEERIAIPLHSFKQNGLLVELALQIPNSYLKAPPEYNRREIQRAVKYSPTYKPRWSSNGDNIPPTIIVFFFESLIDPHDFGRPLQRKVIPNFRELQSLGTHGFAISPGSVTGSADSEFEFLTGMSCSFLPQGSCAYKHFLKTKVPNIATMLRSSYGFRSTAIKCVSPDFYNFKVAYDLLQIDQFCSQENFSAPTIDKFSGYISDNSFVDEMLRPLTNIPCMVFGESLNSHSPYDPHLMGDKPRFLLEPSNSASDQIETYLQAISRTDDALGRMIHLLRQRKDRVIVLVIGDHHPPLASDSNAYDSPNYQAPGPAGELFRRRVPFVIWKNFDAIETKIDSTKASPATNSITYISMNFLSLVLMREAGIQPTGLIGWNQKLFNQCPVVSRDLYYSNSQAKNWDQLPVEIKKLIHDYELLQYDIMFGEKYSEELWTRANPGSPNSIPSKVEN